MNELLPPPTLQVLYQYFQLITRHLHFDIPQVIQIHVSICFYFLPKTPTLHFLLLSGCNTSIVLNNYLLNKYSVVKEVLYFFYYLWITIYSEYLLSLHSLRQYGTVWYFGNHSNFPAHPLTNLHSIQKDIKSLGSIHFFISKMT